MSESLARLGIIGALVVVVVVGARLAARWFRPSHPPVALDGLGLPAGLVVFTATDCTTCAAARTVVEQSGVPVREVTHELEPALFERAAVEAVPLTVVVSSGGGVVAQFTGVPARRALARAVRRAGLL